MRQLRVKDSAAAAVERGHPWVFRDALAAPKGRPLALESGEVVELHGSSGFLALALADAASPIGARVLSRAREAIDGAWLERRLGDAIELRERLAPADTDALRLVAGEGDRLPGVVVDRYADVAVLRLDGDLWRPWLDRLAGALAARLGPRGVRTLGLRQRGEGERLRLLWGPEPADPLWVREHGVALEVSVLSGQKTGAFLDQRENRRRVRAWTEALARSRPVHALNLFSYTGGFSIAAALGGARAVTSVDVSAPAMATATRIFRRNGLEPGAHGFVVADAFAFLERAAREGRRFDLVVSDPPSFAPSERAKPAALKAYRRLHAACAAVLAPGGLFCAASCSSHVSLEELAATLDDAALGRSDLRLLELHGGALDHPTLPAWPEGRYLKLALLG